MKQSQKKVYQNLYDTSGGLLKSESISKEPRNLKQIYNVKASAKKNEDELFELVEQIKYNDKYIKELCVGESIQYILASDDQLFDLERQVTNPVSFSVLSFDPTFKLGEFYVTTSTYENQFLCHRSGTMAGKHPFFCWTCVCASLYEFRIVLLLLFYSSENTIWIEKHPSYWI